MKTPSWWTGVRSDGSPYEPDGEWALYFSHINDYMRRLLLRLPWFTLRLHWILRPDLDENCHDHPFWMWILVLRGGYVEEVEDANGERRQYDRRPGSARFLPATWAHRIVSVEPRTLTFCVGGPKMRKWGFHTADGWVYWRDYFRGGGSQ